MQPTIVQQGLDLMLYGMGTVFVFLCCMIVVTSLMSRIAQRWPDDLSDSPNPSSDIDQRTTAIIQQALSQHRKKLNIP
jgi:oxaloacetate decarboxylase gamma subunit